LRIRTKFARGYIYFPLVFDNDSLFAYVDASLLVGRLPLFAHVDASLLVGRLPRYAEYRCPVKPWSCDECAQNETDFILNTFPTVSITNDQEFREVSTDLFNSGLVGAPKIHPTTSDSPSKAIHSK
jgi:hypothetical protein